MKEGRKFYVVLFYLETTFPALGDPASAGGLD